MERKRSLHWLTEPSASASQLHKRQVVESGPHISLSASDNSLVPTHLPDCLFDPANAHHTSDQHFAEPRRYIQEQCNNVPSLIGFPVIHTLPGNLDTITKLQVNQVSESGNIPGFMVQLYGEGVSGPFEMGPSYNSGQDSTLSFGQTFSDIDNILSGQFANKADNSSIPNSNNESVDIYDKGDGTVLSTAHPFEKGVENFLLMGQSLLQKADCNIFSMSPSYNKGQDNFASLLSCDKVPDNVFMAESNYKKENANLLSGGQSSYTEGGEIAFLGSSRDRAYQNNDQICHEDRSKSISFGAHQQETTVGSTVRVINSYENFSHDPATAKDHLHMEAEENMSFEYRNPPCAIPRFDTLLVPTSKHSKTAKKGSTISFPTNVKSLLSTGMFDGVTVKYCSWSREKNLKGIIKGTGYLCCCGNCNHDKVLNAYEFERHANCKTKHPNNHIYFESGKTIYSVVQELKNTPREKLFGAIQTVTGSDINYKNFNTWRASYQIASLELQRIYGKDADTLAS